MFVKKMAQIACGAVAVVGQRFNDNSDAGRPVALIVYRLVIVLFLPAGSFFDYAVYILIWYIVGFAFTIRSASFEFEDASAPPSLTTTAISRPIL